MVDRRVPTSSHDVCVPTRRATRKPTVRSPRLVGDAECSHPPSSKTTFSHDCDLGRSGPGKPIRTRMPRRSVCQCHGRRGLGYCCYFGRERFPRPARTSDLSQKPGADGQTWRRTRERRAGTTGRREPSRRKNINNVPHKGERALRQMKLSAVVGRAERYAVSLSAALSSAGPSR